MAVYVKNARYSQPGGHMTAGDFIVGDEVASADSAPQDMEVIDAAGYVLAPALIDMHVHLREPGFEYKETIASGTSAARAGGFSHIVSMPNTNPLSDKPEVIRYILDKAHDAGHCTVLPVGSITSGKELCDFPALLEAGVVAFSDDGRPVESADMMRRALVEVKRAGSFIISHCEELSLAHGAPINEGEVSRRLGLKGNPNSSEDVAVARDVLLAAETGARLHVAHISTRGSVEILRAAKRLGVEVTCETCPHYFTLTDAAVLERGVNAKMNPPLRSEADRQAILEGIADGTIDCISTDHAPHSAEDKFLAANDLEKAANGIVGLETSFALGYTMLVKSGIITIDKLLQLMSHTPARILGIRQQKFMLADLDSEWEVNPSVFKSLSRNTPFEGYRLFGKCQII